MRKNLFLTYSTQHPNVAPFHKIFHLQLSALYIYTIFTPSKYLKYSKIPFNFQKSLKHQKKVNPKISNYRKPTINDTIIAIFTETVSTSKRFNKSTIAIPPIFAHSFLEPNFQKSLKKQMIWFGIKIFYNLYPPLVLCIAFNLAPVTLCPDLRIF